MKQEEDLRILGPSGWNSTSNYLMEWSRKLKAFNRKMVIQRLFTASSKVDFTKSIIDFCINGKV